MSLEYKKIVDNLNTERVINLMKELGIDRYKETDTALLFPTICHNESAPDSSLKLYFYKDTHLFYCYTECGAQSIFTLLRNYYETRGMDYNWFGDIYERARSCADLFSRKVLNQLHQFVCASAINVRQEMLSWRFTIKAC